MAYKVKNPYQNCHIMDLNMMGIRSSVRFGLGEILFMMVPVVIAGACIVASAMPEFGFFAECMNVPNGDVCHISIK